MFHFHTFLTLKNFRIVWLSFCYCFLILLLILFLMLLLYFHCVQKRQNEFNHLKFVETCNGSACVNFGKCPICVVFKNVFILLLEREEWRERERDNPSICCSPYRCFLVCVRTRHGTLSTGSNLVRPPARAFHGGFHMDSAVTAMTKYLHQN